MTNITKALPKGFKEGDSEYNTEVISVMKESFSGITDTRQQAQVRRDLYEIIDMTIAAVIGNCDGWDEIEDFCRNKEVWLRELMKQELEHGIPSETTFARVWERIDYFNEFCGRFRACDEEALGH